MFTLKKLYNLYSGFTHYRNYRAAIAATPNLQWLRWVIIENMLLWLIYDLTIQAYPAAITDVTITLTTLIAIIRNRKTFSKQ